jgi:hypothetical protein
MTYLCTQRTAKVQIKYFMFECSIYRLSETNRCWKRDYFHVMISVYVCTTWGIIELEKRFETWITRNDVNGVILYHFSYLITLMAYQCSQWAPNVQIKYFKFVWSFYRLFVLNRSWKRYSIQTMIFLNVCSTWRIFEIKTSFVTWLTRNDVNGSYLITLMALLFMFVRSIYRPFVLNRSPKRDSLQMMIFVNVCSAWSMVQLKTRFETSITRNDVNGVCLLNLCYLITLTTYLWSQWTPNVQFKYFMFDWSI